MSQTLTQRLYSVKTTDEEWFKALSEIISLASAKRFYLLHFAYKGHSYIKVGWTGQKLLKDRAWVITDGKGKEVPYSVLVDMPDAVPGFDASRMEKRTVANLENVMGAFMDRYHGPAVDKFWVNGQPSRETFKAQPHEGLQKLADSVKMMRKVGDSWVYRRRRGPSDSWVVYLPDVEEEPARQVLEAEDVEKQIHNDILKHQSTCCTVFDSRIYL